MFFSHRVAYSWVILRPSFVSPVFEQWLRCYYLFLQGPPETHHEDRKRKAIRLTTWKYFYSPLLPFFFGVKVPYYIILLYIVICTLSVFLVICRQYDSLLTFLKPTNTVLCCGARQKEEHTMGAWWPRDIYPQSLKENLPGIFVWSGRFSFVSKTLTWDLWNGQVRYWRSVCL